MKRFVSARSRNDWGAGGKGIACDDVGKGGGAAAGKGGGAGKGGKSPGKGWSNPDETNVQKLIWTRSASRTTTHI